MIFLKIKIDNNGVHIPSGFFRKELSIPWCSIKLIEKNEKDLIRVLYRADNDKIKEITLWRTTQFDELMTGWKRFLVEKTGEQGYLSGSIVKSPSRDVLSIIGSVLFSLFILILFFILFHLIQDSFVKLYNEINDSEGLNRNVYIYLFYISSLMMAVASFFVSLGVLMPVIQKFRLRKWRDWRIDKKSFSLKGEYIHFREMSLQPEDVITNREIIISGKNIPWQKFTHNAIFPHLLTMIGEKKGSHPSCSKSPITKFCCIRLMFLWPVIILLAWYLPVFFLTLPEAYDLNILMISKIVIGACFVSGAGLYLYSPFVRKRLTKEFESFKGEVLDVKKQLGW